MKKFYKTVSVEAAGNGYVITLDGRLVKTPGRATLVLPTQAMAEAIAAEWRAQEETVQPDTMHQTRFANTALDRVTKHHDAVVGEIAGFAGTDLLCYRAAEPAELVEMQQEVWDPYLKWAAERYGVALEVTSGIMPVRQDAEALEKYAAVVRGYNAFELTALHAVTSALGSLVLALAFLEDHSPLDAVWRASILDAVHQESNWGTDWEVEEKREKLHGELVAAAEFISHLRNK
ncbi:ATP12 family chaperone protein [Kordiimonas aestuarii]|uniref:ATP12 family chaperone protein n=1 Tax=Kordiimonas aestuarii TaxID=1005925 RepID=UPI0021CFF2F5|nr:ATP12 family protein [Kordiimonas aestuarii]